MCASWPKAAGATYVARTTVAHPRPLLNLIKEGMEHRGFAFLEVISQCPTQAGRYMEGTSNPGGASQPHEEKGPAGGAGEAGFGPRSSKGGSSWAGFTTRRKKRN